MELHRLFGCVLVTCLVMRKTARGSGSCRKLEKNLHDKILDMLFAIKLGEKNEENTLSDKLLEMLFAIKSSENTEDDAIGEDGPAFSMTLSHYKVILSGEGTILKYDNVILNRGNAYSTTTGQFTAPKAGLYQFSVTIMSNHGGHVYMGFYHNGNKLMNMYGPPIHGASETANPVLELAKGDIVDVRHIAGASQEAHGNHYSHMSGFFIRQ